MFARRSARSSRAAASSAPTARAGEDEPRPRQQREHRHVAGRTQVPLQPERQRARPAATRARSASACRTRAPTPRTAATRHGCGPRDRPRQSRAATIAGPMMLRMSTRNSVTRWLPGLTMNAWTRKRNARMKITRPRRHDPLDRAGAAAGPLGRPRRGEHDRQAREPEEQRRGEAAEDRRVAVDDAVLVGRARPRVRGVRFDHHQHGDAARPVDVGAAPRRLVSRRRRLRRRHHEAGSPASI